MVCKPPISSRITVLERFRLPLSSASHAFISPIKSLYKIPTISLLFLRTDVLIQCRPWLSSNRFRSTNISGLTLRIKSQTLRPRSVSVLINKLVTRYFSPSSTVAFPLLRAAHQKCSVPRSFWISSVAPVGFKFHQLLCDELAGNTV